MTNEEINKALTEAMGDSECESMPNHVYVSYNPNLPWDNVTRRFCKYCGNHPLDFFTNEGYGKLRDWYDGWEVGKKERLTDYIMKKCYLISNCVVTRTIYAFHRDRLARLTYEFLQEG